MFKKLRVTIWLYVLLLVAGGAWFTQQHATDWNSSLWVVVHPINADNSATTQAYIDKLNADSFAPIQDFFAREAAQYAIASDPPAYLTLGKQLKERPPAPPTGRNMFGVMLWSLKLRYWAWRMEGEHDGPSNLQMFVLYYDPMKTVSVPHSSGLQKGQIGVIHAFAMRSMAGSNKTIIAHEMLHTLGATDKYDPQTNQPMFPHGYADPNRTPRFPQKKAELMGGRIPISEHEAKTPTSLKRVVIGAQTAAEIGWRSDH
ncbi:MAG: hypothetical protein K0U93_12150 [Gammaproteobacteria bacterium]|nr:hypothetical protein [Gammaproteobacteria bacterium]